MEDLGAAYSTQASRVVSAMVVARPLLGYEIEVEQRMACWLRVWSPREQKQKIEEGKSLSIMSRVLRDFPANVLCWSLPQSWP